MKVCKQGLGFIIDKNWNNRLFKNVGHVLRYGNKAIPKHLKKVGFEATVFECDNYYRLNYGKIIKS